MPLEHRSPVSGSDRCWKSCFQLSLKLQTYKTQAKDPKCVINADAGADFKHVVVVLDEVRRIGIAKVGINTDKK
jgi:biopolymer transport protein ExbD